LVPDFVFLFMARFHQSVRFLNRICLYAAIDVDMAVGTPDQRRGSRPMYPHKKIWHGSFLGIDFHIGIDVDIFNTRAETLTATVRDIRVAGRLFYRLESLSDAGSLAIQSPRRRSGSMLFFR
jgi:hypothetical protein